MCMIYENDFSRFKTHLSGIVYIIGIFKIGNQFVILIELKAWKLLNMVIEYATDVKF